MLFHGQLVSLWVQIDYPSFEKNFYEEHAGIQTLSKADVVELRKKLGLKVNMYLFE